MDPTNFTSGSSALDTIKDLPSGVAVPLVDFETVQSPLAGGEVHFNLTSIVIPGAFGNCASAAVNTQCNIGGGSPFDLFQATANQVEISFTVNMIAYTGTSLSGSNPYEGIFSTTLSGTLPNNQPVTIPNILNFFAAGGTETSTWSAAESPLTASPDPQTFLLLGSGLIGLSMFGRRLRNRAK